MEMAVAISAMARCRSKIVEIQLTFKILSNKRARWDAKGIGLFPSLDSELCSRHDKTTDSDRSEMRSAIALLKQVDSSIEKSVQNWRHCRRKSFVLRLTQRRNKVDVSKKYKLSSFNQDLYYNF